MLNRVEYSNGHHIQDNRVGDYELVCGTAPDQPLFIHPGQVRLLEVGRMACPICEQLVVPRTSAYPPFDFGT